MTASELARQYIEESTDVSEAHQRLVDAASNDRELFDEITQPWLRQACYDLVRRQCRNQRRAIYNAPSGDDPQNGERLIQNARSMMSMPLSSGKQLRHATREDLEAESAFYRKQAHKMASMAQFYASVAEMLDTGQTVGETLDEASLSEIREAA